MSYIKHNMKRKAETMSEAPAPKVAKVETPMTMDEVKVGTDFKTFDELKSLILKRPLDEANPHVRDQMIVFDEEPHDYYVLWDKDGEETRYSKKDVLSVTTMIGHHFNPFDSQATSERIALGRKPNHIREYGEDMTAKSIRDTWTESARLGTEMHLKIEMFYNGQLKPEDYPKTREFRMFLKFASENAHLKPYRTEWIVFTDLLTRVCGSIDMIFVMDANDITRTLTVKLVDWKRSKTITMPNRYFGKGKEGSPCEDMSGVNFNKYSLQLNMYAWIIETFYGGPPGSGLIKYNGKTYDRIKVGGMQLVKCHPNHKKEDYKSYTIADMRNKIMDIINFRRAQLNPPAPAVEPDTSTTDKIETFLSLPYTKLGPRELKNKNELTTNVQELAKESGVSEGHWSWYLGNTYPDDLPYDYLKHHYNW